LTTHADKGEGYASHARDVSDISVSALYGSVYDEWLKAMRPSDKDTRILDVELDGPLVTGTGNASVIDFGITLHPTYGVPYIPGSGIKGMCRRAAHDPYNVNGDKLTLEQITVLFGSTDDKAPDRGYITFWDAWLKPGQAKPLQQDILTPHHPEYQATGTVWPSPSDDPNPIPFLSVKPGTRFTFALSSPEAPEFLPLAEKILWYALEMYGVGAKTNVGYGRASRPEEDR
jgi:CRISPR-associated protein Cmr6